MPEDEAPRRRRHRRVVVPATNAGPEDPPDFTEPHVEVDQPEPVEDAARQVDTDQWWRAQRPPHWG